MKKIILIVAIVLGVQQLSQAQKLEKIFRVNILVPGVEYELPLGNYWSLNTNIGTSVAWSSGGVRDVFDSRSSNVRFYPYLLAEGRRYYNREKRVEKKRRVRFNSGNYYGLSLFTTPDRDITQLGKTKDVMFAISPLWGMQRAYGRFYFNLNFIPFYFVKTKEQSKFYALGFGWRLGFNF
ncbi:MAG: hypothetical protein CR961_01315 [Polaribacter sp.]|nr:MAG: hypothetical protein CR961_01315 [Polaribacter sp.]